MSPAGAVLLMDGALLGMLALVLFLKIRNGPGENRFARAERHTDEVAASTIPKPYIKELTNE